MSHESRGGKIVFANQLRGLAVLCVIVAHYLGIYWFARPIVAQYIGAPVVEGGGPRIFPYVFFAPTFNYGPFGVAVFFLISGFVIPFSLDKLGGVRFIAARMLRIFPTYWVATAFTMFAVYLSTKHWGAAYYITEEQVISNMFLVHQQIGLPTIDMVNWTLCIEVLFYICALLMMPFIKRASPMSLVNFALAIMALITWWPSSWDTPLKFGSTQFALGAFKYQLMMVCFLFIGTLFNFRFHDRISRATLIGSVFAMFTIMLATWPKTPIADQFPSVPLNYFYALVVFSVCFAFRNRFRPLKFIDFFADISYPLYLVHAVSGYAIIRLLMAAGFRYYQAAVVALACSVAVAYILHRVVEVPTANALKKRKQTPAQQAPVTTT
ncbi:acyltransferase family protein [Burkholderia multivorans]|uniref:acyltransferase family protein n=1 Tax=Burkholderia multivorans TaxID=87883 RepID=UPI0020B31305|nr:acyltransferase [Burkholderia multivorans]